MRRWLYENGLSIAMFGIFLLCWIGQSITGYVVYNSELQTHREPTVSYLAYLGSGHFLEATTENWESEFLQMGAYIMLSALLRQKGSPESKVLDTPEDEDADPDPSRPGAPWPVRHGGILSWLYRSSLTITFLLLFAVSFLLHAVGSMQVYNQEAHAHGEPTISLAQFFLNPQLWFESLQNWQSEFLSVGALIVLSIFLRQKGSPESKPVDAPHAQTGRD